MSNMSYCRFQNTSGDLRDCIDAIDDIVGDIDTYGDSENLLSPEEESAADNMEELCRRYLALREELRGAISSAPMIGTDPEAVQSQP
jgi:hypothetical protein